jgi:hypothetical protein
MAEYFTDRNDKEIRTEHWNRLVDTVIDAIVDDSFDEILLDMNFSWLMHARKENHHPDDGAGLVAKWLDSDENVAHIACRADLSQLKIGLKELAITEDPKDLYVNFMNELVYDTYAPIVDTLFGIAFSLFLQDAVHINIFGETDVMPVIGKVFIGPPTAEDYDATLDLFTVGAMIDMYGAELINQSRLRSPNLMLIADLGSMFVLNGMIPLKAAFMIDMHSEELRIADSWVNYGFDTFAAMGMVRLSTLLRLKLGVNAKLRMQTNDYMKMLRYTITSHKYCDIILKAFEDLLKRNSGMDVSMNREALAESEALFQKALKGVGPIKGERQ